MSEPRNPILESEIASPPTHDLGDGLPRVLIVDDEESVLELEKELMESFGYEVATASDGHQAVERAGEGFDLMLLDVMLPGLDGFQVVRMVRRKLDPYQLPIVMVTSMASREDRLIAIQAGANDFINKPLDITELRVRARTQIQMKNAHDSLRSYQVGLERKVRERTRELEQANSQITEAHMDTIRRLVLAAEFKDEDTAQHIERMSRYSAILAKAMGCSDEEVDIIRQAAPMHDVGKIGIPDSVLLKPGRLTEYEFQIMQQHTELGARILDGSPSHLLQAGKVIAMSHHEKWDGSGYPNGLAGEDIPLWGRICAVADVFDALTSERPYKQAFSLEKAFNILREGRARHFDPDVLDCFFDGLDEILRIKGQYSDDGNRSEMGPYSYLNDSSFERR